MRYSVYRYGRNEYDYYEDGRAPTSTHASAPKVTPKAMGSTPEQAAWSLPSNAKKVGSGPLPQGRIASTASASAMGDLPSPSTIAIGAGLAYLAWRVLR